MRTKHTVTSLLMCTATAAAILASAPALGHDPLEDEHERKHDAHHNGHHNSSDELANLSDVRALVVSFRETGNDRYLDDAWTILEPALQAGSPDPETLIAASFVAQSRHEFEYAVKLITKALAIKNNNDEGWLLLASIHLVLGQAESAAIACRQLRNVPPVVLLTCKARVALASGDHEIALARLRKVLLVVDSQRLPPDLLAWSYSVAGDLAAASGESEEAIRLYEQSLQLAERTQVRAALVDVFLSHDDDENAWQALADGSLALPLLVRRLIVAKQLGRLHELQSELSKVEREFTVWIDQEDWLHAREMARFFIDVVDRPDLARRLALINIGLQHEPEDQRLERRTRPVADQANAGAIDEILVLGRPLRYDIFNSLISCEYESSPYHDRIDCGFVVRLCVARGNVFAGLHCV